MVLKRSIYKCEKTLASGVTVVVQWCHTCSELVSERAVPLAPVNNASKSEHNPKMVS